MTRKLLVPFAWLAVALTVISSLYNMGQALLAPGAAADVIALSNRLLWLLLPIAFVLPATLIVTRQPRNTIGWLLMAPGVTRALPWPPPVLAAGPPAGAPTPLLLAALWIDGWSWLALVFPIILIPLLFPDGRPPTRRWRWVGQYAAGMFVFFLLFGAFLTQLGPADESITWRVANPIGFIDMQPALEAAFIVPWMLSLAGVTMASASALVVRYRRSAAAERQQIKWLLYASGIFAAVYTTALALRGATGTYFVVLDTFMVLSMLLLPASVGIAILRHRLFDIDIIIRRTLVYGLVTGLLGFMYFGTILILQSLFSVLMGGQSTLAIVISTLAIAGLFTPVRRRVQVFIDRRFYRQKYDAAVVLANFAGRTRDQTDLDALSADLLGVVRDTMQPAAVSLWMNRKESGAAAQSKRLKA